MKHSYTNLNVERHQHTVLVTLHNPPAHTWTADSLAALAELLADLNGDADVYALVITGDGPRFFSAGADLKLFADGDKVLARTMAQRFGLAFEALAAFRAGLSRFPGDKDLLLGSGLAHIEMACASRPLPSLVTRLEPTFTTTRRASARTGRRVTVTLGAAPTCQASAPDGAAVAGCTPAPGVRGSVMS